MRTLVLTQNNIVNSDNNTLVYNFPNSIDLTGSSVAFSSVNMYYSWDNINITYQNNTFQYVWRSGTTNTTYTVVIPDGLYEIKDLNNFLQYTFIANGHYLVNSSGQNVYYAEFIVNPTRYGIQINTYPLPISLPSGWSNPAALVFPTQNFNPQIILTANFNQVLGFVSGFTTDLNLTVNTILSYISSVSPQITPTPNLLVALSGIDNKYSNPTSVIYSIVPNVGIGQLINQQVSEFSFNKFQSGTYASLRLQFLSPSNFQPVRIRDPQMTILLIIRDPEDDILDVGGDSPLKGFGYNQTLLSRSGQKTDNLIRRF